MFYLSTPALVKKYCRSDIRCWQVKMKRRKQTKFFLWYRNKRKFSENCVLEKLDFMLFYRYLLLLYFLCSVNERGSDTWFCISLFFLFFLRAHMLFWYINTKCPVYQMYFAENYFISGLYVLREESRGAKIEGKFWGVFTKIQKLLILLICLKFR